jgi:Glycosyl hydrolases family 16
MPGVQRGFSLWGVTFPIRTLVCATAVLLFAAPAGAATRTFSPTADAYLNPKKPNRNYGSAGKLSADGRPAIRSYLKFDVQLPAGAVVDGATLKLYAQSRSTPGFTVNAVSTDGWSERTISYANAPSLASKLGASGGSSSAGYKGVALPASAIQAGLNSFAIRTASRSGITFSSREGSHKPELKVSYTGSDRTSPGRTPGSGPMPTGVAGIWRLAFDDEFDGTVLDRSKWTAMEGGNMNNVTTTAGNVSVGGGVATLQLSDSTHGAEICTCIGRRSGEFTLPPGGVAEARVYFPGSDNEHIYNWPGWWVSGPNWPTAGEHDIAEGLGGDLTVNYHSSSGAHNFGDVDGRWDAAFHTFTLHRKASRADVYWDGRLVKSYATDDNGDGDHLIVNVGASGRRTAVTGSAGAVKVDYVRAWVPG